MDKLQKTIGLFITLIACVLPYTYSQTAKIKNVTYRHDVNRGEKMGMEIYVSFSVHGMKGKKVNVAVFFYDTNKHSMTAYHNDYKNSSGHLCTWKYSNLIPYENAAFDDYVLFIPYDAMDLKTGEHSYFLLADIRNSHDEVLASSGYRKFKTENLWEWVYRNTNGTYKKKRISKEGSIVTLEQGKCWHCTDGLCSRCHGTGGFYTMAGHSICGTCSGKKVCLYCGGTKFTLKQYTYNPVTGIGVLVDFHLKTVTSSISNGSDYKSNSRDSYSIPKTTVDDSCPNCHGNGKCTGCAGRGEYKRDGRYYDCPICNGTGRCQSCYGSGKLR